MLTLEWMIKAMLQADPCATKLLFSAGAKCQQNLKRYETTNTCTWICLDMAPRNGARFPFSSQEKFALEKTSRTSIRSPHPHVLNF